jgi:Leucine-rich repeat (LRR) protein
MNGEAFQTLSKLKKLWLNSNPCINVNFIQSIDLAKVKQVVTENCSYLETEILATTNEPKLSNILCEKIKTFNWTGDVGKVKTCFMTKTTLISKTGEMISIRRDSLIKVLDCSDNKKIQFLPENVGDRFPNLLHHRASNCNIIEVSKKNFQGLFKLRLLDLSHNQIEKIPSNTFEYLEELEQLLLREKHLI